MADLTYQPKVYRKDGGDTLVIASGGTLQIEAGALIYFGENDAGVDAKFFGDTAGKYMLWDTSADQLYLVGSLKHHNHLTTESYGHQLRTEYNAGTGDFFGIDAEAHQAVDRTAGGVRGLSMCARLVAAKTISGSANMNAGHFLLDIDGTINGTGLFAALVAKVDAGGTFTAVGHLASLWVDSLQEGTVNGEHELIYATNNGAATMDQLLYVDNGATGAGFTNFITFAYDQNPILTNALVPAAAPDAGTVGADRAIKIKVGSAAYYIPLYDTLHA